MRSFLMVAVSFASLWSSAQVRCAEPAEDIHPSSSDTIAFLLDCSNSMSGRKERALKEATKLAIAILNKNYKVLFVDFNQSLRSSVSAKLDTLEARERAMNYVDRRLTGGGTNYLAGLRASALPRRAPALFVSDGLHEGSHQQVLDFLRTQYQGGPLYTVAIEAPPKANALLAEMAAITGGAHASVDDVEMLVETIVTIMRNLANYRVYKSSENEVALRVRGASSLVAIGFDTQVAIGATPPVQDPIARHIARFSQRAVSVSSVRIRTPTTLSVRAVNKRAASGNLAILRDDLYIGKLQLSRTGTASTGGDIRAKTTFRSPHGNPVSKDAMRELTSRYEVVQNGKVISSTDGIPAGEGTVFEGVIQTPQQPGSFTIRNHTTARDSVGGPAFEATYSTTLIAVDPIELMVEPRRIDLTATPGSFSLDLNVMPFKPAAAKSLTYTAVLREAPVHLRLVDSKSSGDRLTVKLRADRPGTYRGCLVIHGNAPVPVSPLSVPYTIRIRPRFLGLALPRSNDVRLGVHHANSGQVKVATWDIPSLDSAAIPDIAVRVTDLSNGKNVIPFHADQATIDPARDKPASLGFVAEVGNVAAGIYAGKVVFRLTDVMDDRRWTVNVGLTVTEPLAAFPLAFGKVEVGNAVKRTLMVSNDGGSIRNVELTLGPFRHKEGELDPTDIAVVLSEQFVDLPGKSETPVEVTLTLSPLLQARGPSEATLRLVRVANQRVEVPIRMEIVGAGDGASDLIVAPEVVRLKGKSGEVLTFDLQVKLADSAAGLVGVSVESCAFEDSFSQVQPVDMDFVFAGGTKLSASKRLTIKGTLIAPDTVGSFRGGIIIRSVQAGSQRVPVTLQVK